MMVTQPTIRERVVVPDDYITAFVNIEYKLQILSMLSLTV